MSKQFSDRKAVGITIGILLLLLALPLTLMKFSEPQDTRTSANAETTLAFAEGTPVNTTVGSRIPLTIVMNPNSNLISYLKIVVTYDPSKLRPIPNTSFIADSTVFPVLLAGPVYGTNTITAEMTVGPDATRAISARSNVATVTFEAIAATKKSGTSVSLQNGSFALSLSGDTSADENVISGTTPISVVISDGQKGSGGGGTKGGPKPR